MVESKKFPRLSLVDAQRYLRGHQDSGPEGTTSMKPRGGLRGFVGGNDMSALLPSMDGRDHPFSNNMPPYSMPLELQYSGPPGNFPMKPRRSLLDLFSGKGMSALHDSGPQVDSSVRPRPGLRGIVSGKEISALADSGADHNIITIALAQKRGLKIEASSADFQLGNSKPFRSLGE